MVNSMITMEITDLEHPHESRKHENGYGPLLHNGKSVYPIEIRRDKPKEECNRDDQRKHQAQLHIDLSGRMYFCHIFRLYQITPCSSMAVATFMKPATFAPLR